MPLNIEILEKDVPGLAEFYKTKLAEAKELAAGYERVLAALGSNGTPVAGSTSLLNVPHHGISNNGYNKKWTWVKKIEYVLGRKPSTTTELVNTILSYEPNSYDRKKVVATISAMLSMNSKEDGIYLKEKDKEGNNVYSLNK